MDTFELCRIASERVAWSFESAVEGLSFDFERRFLPQRICGQAHPSWLSPSEQHQLNHLRGFSYAHIFLFVEEFIIHMGCRTAMDYVHEDIEALSALLRFSEEETKHQRLFVLVKSRLAEGLGFTPRELPNKEGVARAINQKAPFAVFLLTLVLEWLTQRHYIECFQRHEANLDRGFVRVFRLHWTEEAQHARIDTVQLRRIAAQLDEDGLKSALADFLELLTTFVALLAQQDELDLQNLEHALGQRFSPTCRAELLAALNQEWLWTFLVSGIDHRGFQAVFHDVVPSQLLTIPQLKAHLGWTDPLPDPDSQAPPQRPALMP